MAISVGSVEVDVIPNTQGIYQRLRGALVPAATRAGEDAGSAAGRAFGPAMQGRVGDIGLRIGEQIGQQIASRVTAQVRGALRDGVDQGGAAARTSATRQGDETGGAFSRAMKARLEAAFRSLPQINIDADTSEADSDLQALRARMETLAGRRIGIDIDAAAARAEVTEIEEQLRRLGAAHPNVAVRADTARARAELAAVREEIDRISARPGRVHLETDGSFGQRLRAQIQAAEASLPNINISADTTPAQAEIASLRGQLTALRDQRIGIDVDASTALARITEIQARLERLSASDVDVAVRVDAGTAMAQLAVVQAMVTRLDGQDARINVNAASALSAIMHLGIAIAGLAAIPAIPVIAAGIGSIASAAVAASVGVGALVAVAAPAIVKIAGVLQAQKAAQDAATTSTLKGAQASGQGASKALQMAGAQQSLASATRNAGRQIRQAEQGIADAVRSSADANRQAAQQVKQAKQSLVDAVQQAADQQQTSAEQVARAEESLADAQRTAKRAQQDLTQARVDAAQELADLADKVANAQLSERDAVLDVQDARARLRATQAVGSKATLLEQQRAQLSYDQAVQRLKEQKAETKALSDEKKKADKAGVEGSDTVKSAQEQIAAAEKDVVDQGRALAKARDEASRQQVKAQQDIVAAQEKVAQSQRNVTRVQEDGARSVARAQESLVAAQDSAADSIASAQRQIASASASAAGGVDQAALAQAKYQQELAKLTPAARGTLDAFTGLKTAFTGWSEGLQPKVMPLFTRALIGLKNALPGLTPFALAAADAIGTLMDRASAGFKSPWWKTFKDDLAKAVGPATVGLGVSFGRIFKGMAGVIQAFLPHMDTISASMQRITKRFADWGASLKGSDKFEGFLAYSSRTAPGLADSLGKVVDAFFQLSKATAPLSGPVLQALGAVASAIGSLARDLPWLIQLIYAAWIATKLWTLAVLAFNLVMNANVITLIIVGIVALVAAVIYAYKNFGWFRTAVQATWAGIQAAAVWAWGYLQPVFDGIWTALQALGAAAMWLWENALSPAFKFIVAAGKILATVLITAVLVPIVLQFKVLAAVATWLWDVALGPLFRQIATGATWLWKSIFAPAFRGIGTGATWVWNKAIKPAFTAMRTGLRQVGDGATWLWKNAIRPAFGWIADRGRWLWDKGLKPAFGWIKTGIKAVADSFTSAKDTIGKQWSKVSDIAKKPIRFVIDKIYNAGIVPTWNLVAKAFGAPPLGKMKTEGWATGGVLPGYTPGRDVHQFMSPTGGGLELSGGEAIMRPEWTRAVGPGYVAAMNAAARRGGTSAVRRGLTSGYADGGIFGWIGKGASALAGAGSSLWDSVKKGASWLKDTIAGSARAGLNAVVNPLLAKVPGADTGFGKMIRKMPSKILDAIFGYSEKADDKSVSSIGGVIPSGQHRAIISQALAAAGVPPPGTVDQWLSGMNTLITRESGWNASAINLWDSNAKAGHPSQGLTQTIPGTWSAYVPPALRFKGILDPVGNVAASIRYIVSRYGGIGNVQQANANLSPAGYDSGGYLQPGLNLAYNGTGRPEPVFTTQQANALTNGGGVGGLGDLSVKVFVGNEEIHHIARAEIHRANGELIQVLSAGGGQ